MISNIGSVQSLQADTGVRKVQAQPTESRQQSITTPEAKARPAAVVQIGGEARALATLQEEGQQSRVPELSSQSAAGSTSVQRSRLGEISEARTEIEIEPVVAQPVPDFNAPAQELNASPIRSAYGSASAATSAADQASRGREFVA